jgi:hypothetical protein
MVRLLSVNVGLPRDVTWNGKTVRTAIWKTPVVGRQMVRKLDVVGDAQADLAGHGGEQRAVFVYQMDAYQFWELFLGRKDFIFGHARVGRVRSKQCSNKTCNPQLRWEIRDSPMRNKHPHGPDFDRCESRILIRKAIG